MNAQTKHFQKPMSIAITAAVIGILIHLAVFFAIDVGVSTISAENPGPRASYQYAGSLHREISQFRDPLQLYLTSDYNPSFTELQNFRSLSISRELSSFPARFIVTPEMEWSAWTESQETVMNPATLIDSPEFNPFYFYQRKDFPVSTHGTPSIRVMRTNLKTGEAEEFAIAAPDWFLDREPVRVQLQPARFLIDGRVPTTQKRVLQISSSGDDTTDRSYLRLIRKHVFPEQEGSYYELIIYPGYFDN